MAIAVRLAAHNTSEDSNAFRAVHVWLTMGNSTIISAHCQKCLCICDDSHLPCSERGTTQSRLPVGRWPFRSRSYKTDTFPASICFRYTVQKSSSRSAQFFLGRTKVVRLTVRHGFSYILVHRVKTRPPFSAVCISPSSPRS